MRRYLFPLIAFIILMTFFFLALTLHKHTSTEDSWFHKLNDNSKVTVDINGKEFTLETAISFSKTQQGLMNRTDIPDNGGMLFAFELEAPRTFWMHNTPTPLDIIFLDRDLRVVNTHFNTKPSQISELYPSAGAIKYVIELKSNNGEELGISRNDQIKILNISE
jgi:uncharacterized protein